MMRFQSLNLEKEEQSAEIGRQWISYSNRIAMQKLQKVITNKKNENRKNSFDSEIKYSIISIEYRIY